MGGIYFQEIDIFNNINNSHSKALFSFISSAVEELNNFQVIIVFLN